MTQEKSDDAALKKILQACVNDLKNRVRNSQQKPCYAPDNIRVRDSGIMIIGVDTFVSSITESVRSIGVVLYHFATGESEHNSENYRIDGYESEPQTPLGPVIMDMIHGHIRSLEDIEVHFGWKRKCLEHAAKGKILLSNCLIWMSGQFLTGKNWISGRILCAKDFASTQPEEFFSLIGLGLFIMTGILLVWYWFFNWDTSGLSGLLILSLITLLSVFWVINSIVASGNVTVASRKMGICICTVLMLSFAATSFWTPSWQWRFDDKNVIDRWTGKFEGKMPRSREQLPLAIAWKSSFFNHFRYYIVPGIPLNNSIAGIIAESYGTQKIEMNYKVHISIEPAEYLACCQKYHTGDEVETQVKRNVDKVILTNVKNGFDEEVKKYGDNVQGINKEVLMQRLYEISKNEISKINIPFVHIVFEKF